MSVCSGRNRLGSRYAVALAVMAVGAFVLTSCKTVPWKKEVVAAEDSGERNAAVVEVEYVHPPNQEASGERPSDELYYCKLQDGRRVDCKEVCKNSDVRCPTGPVDPVRYRGDTFLIMIGEVDATVSPEARGSTQGAGAEGMGAGEPSMKSGGSKEPSGDKKPEAPGEPSRDKESSEKPGDSPSGETSPDKPEKKGGGEPSEDTSTEEPGTKENNKSTDKKGGSQ